MKVYVGQARGSKLIAELTALGFGEMTVREEFPPRRRPWAFDNGAFKDFKAGSHFDVFAFKAVLEKIEAGKDRPDFAVIPDIVEGGMASLGFSLSWVPRLRDFAPLYLAVQDGMNEEAVARVLDDEGFHGVFVGGSLRWKIRTGKRWVELAHQRSMACHIGRVGTFRRTRWAQRIGADSIDSCLPLWSEENMRSFLAAFAPMRQREIAPW